MNSARRRVSVLTAPAIRLVIAVAAFFVLGWPLIQIAGARGTASLFVYVFATWAVLVLVLALIGRALRRRDRERPGRKGS